MLLLKKKAAMLLLLGPVLVQSSMGPASSAPSAPAATAQGDDPAIVTFDGVGVITDPGIDPTCSDIDFEDADVVVSNLGGTKHCCNFCPDDTDYLCCPTMASDETSMNIARIPYTVTNARQIFDTDYMKYNVCHDSPGAALTGVITPHEGTTEYIKLRQVQASNGDGGGITAPLSLIFKATSDYFPAWPILGDCAGDCADSEDFTRNEESGDTLKPAGYLNNGRKTGDVQANDLIQVNLCSERFLNLRTSFVDDLNQDVTLMHATMRFFDIDHGRAKNQGPEVMQFDCTGGTFTLYGYEEEDTGHDGEFLVHMSTLAKALKRNDTDEKTVNGLPIHVFDCPDDEWVTLWSSRRGKQSDNPV